VALDRISTNVAMKNATSDFLRAQMRQSEAQVQVSTGKRANDLKGFSRDATTLTAARTVRARVDAFLDNSRSLVGRLDSQNLALDRTRQVAENARGSIASSVAAGQAGTLMIELNSWFGQAAQSLNSKHDGTYLFAGGRVDVTPVPVTSLSDLAALPGVADAFENDESPPVSRLDETTTAVSGFLADDVGAEFFGILRDIQIYHEGPNGPLTGQLTEAQSDFLESKLPLLNAAHDQLIARTAENGLIQRRIEDAVSSQTARSLTLEGFIASVSDVDMAEALTRLEQAQLGLQAAAYAINALKSSSLLELLKPS
jgi:flagellar hook-associated protein 3 FlgL